jgi:HlyD family secretion protein
VKFFKAFVLFALAIGFVAGASLLRPTITKALGKKSSKSELDKQDKEKQKSFNLQFGYDQTVPVVEVSKPTKGTISQAVTAPGSISAGSEVSIGAPFAGTVLGLAVDEGDAVKKGDLIFALDPTEYQERFDEAEMTLLLRKVAINESNAELADAAIKLEEALKEGKAAAVKEKELALSKSQISLKQSKARLQNAESKAKRSQLLFKKGLGTEVEVEAAQSELKVAKLTLEIAEEDLQLAKDSLSLQIESSAKALRDLKKARQLAKLKLDRSKTDRAVAELNVKRAKRDLEKTRIMAPMAGIITLRNINSGENINRNDSSSAATSHYIISNFSRMYVYADVDEGDIVKVKKGQRVVVRVNALGDDEELLGEVLEIGNRAAKDGETLYFRVRILVKKAPPQLRPGMTANVEIETKRVDKVMVVPIQSVGQRRRRDIKDQDLVDSSEGKGSDILDIVFVAVEGKAQLRVIELGISDGDVVQAIKGVKKVDKIITGPYRVLEALHHGDPVNPQENERKGKKNKGKKNKGKKNKGKKNKGKKSKDKKSKDKKSKDKKSDGKDDTKGGD